MLAARHNDDDDDDEIFKLSAKELCIIESFEIELFDHLTVCKQMTDV